MLCCPIFYLFYFGIAWSFQPVACLIFCCVTVDEINETMAAFYNDTDLFSGEFWHPLVFSLTYSTKL